MRSLKGKFCWLAKQHKKGWRLGFCFGNAPTAYVPIWFASAPDVAKAMKGGLLFVHMRSVEGPKAMNLAG